MPKIGILTSQIKLVGLDWIRLLLHVGIVERNENTSNRPAIASDQIKIDEAKNEMHVAIKIWGQSKADLKCEGSKAKDRGKGTATPQWHNDLPAPTFRPPDTWSARGNSDNIVQATSGI